MDIIYNKDPIAYDEAMTIMNSRVDDVIAGKADEAIWFLEHAPCYTGGTSAKPADLLSPQFPVFETGRGGEYTYHGVGQQIAYLILDLKKRQQTPDLKKYINDLEQVIIDTLSSVDVKGERRSGRVGVWVVLPDGTEEKIAAIGVRVRKWVTSHGISINVSPDLSHYSGIVPCGIAEHGVTSLDKLGKDLNIQDALLQNIQKTFGI